MKESRSCKSLGWAALLVCGLLGIGSVFADECPECVDPHNNACKLWAGGQARFQWATGKNITSDITLTAGPCGEPGESGTAYVFAYMNNHRLQCDGDSDTNPCGGDMQASDAFAIIKVSGNQKAFKHIFPGGITFTGNYEVPASPRSHWAYTTVDKAGCDYQLPVGYPQGMRVKLTADVAQCRPEFDNSKFGINITFWQTRHNNPYDYTMLARAQGSITVKANKRTDCDPISFKPDLRDGSATAWIEEITRDYSSGGDNEWMISYTGEDYGGGTCSPKEGWLGPYYLHNPGDLVPASQTFCRVKFPAYKKDVYGTPGYAGMEGWSYSLANKTITLNLGSSGTVYYHCDRKSGNKYVLSSIEYCADGVTAGNGETKWKMLYDGNDRLQYIYNGISAGDPNNPQTGTEYYSFTWDDNDPDVDYFSRKDTQSSWGLQRQWELEFDNIDGEDRAVKFKSNCSGGCGGSGEFEHIQYDTTYTDVIAKRFNAAGNPILENTIDQLTYGQYEPAYWVWIANQGFEFPDVPTGYWQITEVPGWDRTSGDPDDVLIYDPNTSQVLRLTGAVTLEQATTDVIWPDTKYYLEASVRSIPGGGQGTATISLCSNELGMGSPLRQLTYTGSNGVWTQVAETWDSATYSGTNPDAEFIITITGNNVEVDDVWLSALAFVGNQTKPVITEQKVRNNAGQMVTAATWQYDKDNFIVREKKYVDGSNYIATKYEYEDGTFTVLKKRIACETLNDNPDTPTGQVYTTLYDLNDTLQTYATYYPNGKRADVEVYAANGLLIESYIYDTVADANTLYQQYEHENLRWEEDPLWEVKKHTSPRGGVTEYTYTADYLVQTQKNPAAPAGQQEIQYEYDGAKRVIKEKRKDTDGNWIETRYDYDADTGQLRSVVADWGGIHARTRYRYNTLGQVIRQFNPDNVVTGKSYGLGGELVSEFVISASSDPNDPDSELTLISQTRYEYNADGQLEKVKQAKAASEFTYDNPDDWIVTKYEYDSQGRRTKIIEDYDDLGQRFNLTTTWEYDLQGQLKRTTYPTGRRVDIVRDGRGLVILEVVGYAETDVYWTAFDYDANGNLIWQRNPDGTEYEWEYDNFDRVVKAPYVAPPETDWRNEYFRTHRPPSMNLYEYANSNPTNYTDPWGLQPYFARLPSFAPPDWRGDYIWSGDAMVAATPSMSQNAAFRAYWTNREYARVSGRSVIEQELAGYRAALAGVRPGYEAGFVAKAIQDTLSGWNPAAALLMGYAIQGLDERPDPGPMQASLRQGPANMSEDKWAGKPPSQKTQVNCKQPTAPKGVAKPSVTDPKLNNLVEDLYKGTRTPNQIGSGSTADAIRNELMTGQPTYGRFHSQKGREYARALQKWLQKNPNASAADRVAAQRMLNDLNSALGGN